MKPREHFAERAEYSKKQVVGCQTLKLADIGVNDRVVPVEVLPVQDEDFGGGRKGGREKTPEKSVIFHLPGMRQAV